jgi:hypothetical protein
MRVIWTTAFQTALDRGPCSETTGTKKEAQCKPAVPVDQNYGSGPLQKWPKWMEGRMKKKSGNVGSEHDTCERRWELWTHWRCKSWEEWWLEWDWWCWIKDSDLKEETNSINVMYNMFSNIYILSNVSRKCTKLLHKITFFVQTWFLVWGCLIFGIIFHSRKYGSTLKKWLVL